MNKKGSLGIAIITSIFVFIIGLAVINLLLPEVTNFRINMNCADAENINDGVKLLCLVGDVTIPYWILLIISITIGGIVAKFVL